MDATSILTITPNATQDRVYLIDDFAVGRIHRPAQFWTFAGGKGVNVARAFSRLGGRAACTGFLGGAIGAQARVRLAEEGLGDEFVTIEGESRLCMHLCDTVNQRVTEVNEPGPTVTQADVDAVTERIRRVAPTVRVVAICGRNACGAPDSAYADWLTAAKEAGAMTVLDTSGSALPAGLAASPDILKVNALEFGELLGVGPLDADGVSARLRDPQVQSRIPKMAIVTCGAEGIVGLADGSVFHASCPARAYRSPVGSGDAFLGGFLWTLFSGAGFEEQLRYGVATAAANLETFCPCDITREAVQSALGRASVTHL